MYDVSISLRKKKFFLAQHRVASIDSHVSNTHRAAKYEGKQKAVWPVLAHMAVQKRSKNALLRKRRPLWYRTFFVFFEFSPNPDTTPGENAFFVKNGQKGQKRAIGSGPPPLRRILGWKRSFWLVFTKTEKWGWFGVGGGFVIAGGRMMYDGFCGWQGMNVSMQRKSFLIF